MKNTNNGPLKTETELTNNNEIVALPISLRDWFAGMALSGYLAGRNNNPERETLHDRAAISCYAYADAMLAARERKEAE